MLDFTAHKLQDETQWAEKNQEVQYQEQMMEAFSTFLADNINDVYMMLDEGEKAEFITANTERVLGIPRQDLIANPKKSAVRNMIPGMKSSWKTWRL